jgi:hypothetical protein
LIHISLKNNKHILINTILVAAILNIIIFCIAYPEMLKPSTPVLARDFSAYYIGSWRLVHNPSQIYSWSFEPGDYEITPNPAPFKYPPSFLLIILPFLAFNYQNAMILFNFVQLLLFFALALFVYEIVKSKKTVHAIIVSIMILIQPLPYVLQSPDDSSIGLFLSYYIGWCNGNAHILQVILLVGAIYFALYKKPWLCSLLFSFGMFDPRAGIVAIPLLLLYNYRNNKLEHFLFSSFVFISITNVSFLFYNGVYQSFLDSTFNIFTIIQWYPYDWLPIYSILALSMIETKFAILRVVRFFNSSSLVHKEKRIKFNLDI